MVETSVEASAVPEAAILEPRDWSDTEKEERMCATLAFLAETGLVLPPTAIHRNLHLQADLSVTYATVRRYLNDLVEMGLVRRVERGPLDDRELVDVVDGTRAWYVVTKAGLDAHANAE